jgi:Glycine zipper 2TM domain
MSMNNHKESTMRTTIFAGLAVAGLMACGRGSAQSAADSTRSITLASGDSSYLLNDAPSVGATPRAPAAPAPSSPTPRPNRSLTLGSGTLIDAITDRTISSRNDKAGATFTARVASDAKDSQGRVVVPAGSTLSLTITELQPADDKGKADGKITVAVHSVTIGGQTYAVSAGIASMDHTLQGRGVGTTEVLKTGAGTVLGGVAGRVIGGNKKGTIIGAVVGSAAGAVIAAQTANRDVVVVAGTPLVVSLNEALTVTVR